MFGGKKKGGRREGGQNPLMGQLGMGTDLASMEQMMYGDLEDDEELERELAMLQGEDPPSTGAKPKKGPVHAAVLDQMVKESLKDIDDDDINEEDLENDPELMAELNEIAGDDSLAEPAVKRTPSPMPLVSASDGGVVATLEERLKMYQSAYDVAKANNEGSKARRYDRGLKTVQDLLKTAKKGKPVNEDDIPPPVAAGTSKPQESKAPPPAPVAPPVFEPTIPDSAAAPEPTPAAVAAPQAPAEATPAPARELKSEDAAQHKLLTTRRDQYKMAALTAKRAGDETTARQYLKTMKQFDAVIGALEEGRPIDLSKMPPPPGEAPVPAARIERASAQASATPSNPAQEEELPDVQLTDEDRQKMFNAPAAAGSVMEALQQRLDKYKSAVQQAQNEGASSKVRRMGRIVKQYQDAIKAHKAGKPVDFAELPTPPGFPPIPVPSDEKPAAPPAQAAARPTPAPRQPPTQAAAGKKAVSPGAAGPRSRNDNQMQFLKSRQLQFKKAAMEAKNKGDIEQAKTYLKMAKGFDPMIEAAEAGLPVNMAEVPTPPGERDDGFEFVKTEQLDDQPSGDRAQVYKQLEQDLIAQIRSCSNNADHFTKLGDVSSASKFDKLGVNARRDLSALKNAYKHGDPVPRFHYETRSFSMVKCNSELGDNDLEIQIVRGLHYRLPEGYTPSDMSTYVKWEFPFPTDKPQSGYSDTHKETDNPEYDQTFKIQVNRTSRSFLRLLKNRSIKFEIYYKRGFFKSDKVLGTVNFKLLPLETHCVVHESCDLMDGRKACGGKLEVKVRVRDPFTSKQVEEVKEKWLIIEKFERALESNHQTTSNSKAPSGAGPMTSMEVLKYEKQLLDKQLQKYEGRLGRSEEDALRHKGTLISKQIEDQRAQIKQGGMAALRAYADAIEKTMSGYAQEAQVLHKQGNRDKAQILMNKKTLVERELQTIRAKIPRS